MNIKTFSVSSESTLLGNLITKYETIFQSDSCEDDQLTFSLICKVEQTASSGTYYQNENDQQLVEVVVEVIFFIIF